MNMDFNSSQTGSPKTSPRRLILSCKRLLEDERFVPAVLVDHGHYVSPSAKRDVSELLAGTMNMELPELILLQQTGWYDGSFVLPSGDVIGPSSDKIILQNEALTSVQWRNGDATEFQRLFQKTWIDGNHQMRIAILAAAAGPLCAFCGIEPPIFALIGRSSSGKSSALKIASSFNGHPFGKHGSTYMSLRATTNGSEGRFADRSGMTVCMDEMQLFQDTPQALIFMITEGKGKARSDQRGDARPVKSFTIAALISSEISIADLAKEFGKPVATGMNVRCFDIDVSEVSPVEDTTYHEIMEGIEKHYGHGLPMLAEKLVLEDRSNLLNDIHHCQEHLLDQLTGAPTNYQKRAAEKFAVLMIASELLADCNLLPDFGPEPDDVVMWAWKQAVADGERLVSDPDGKAIETLRNTLIFKRGGEFVSLDAPDLPAYRDKLAWYSEQNNCLYLPSEQLIKWSGNTLTQQVLVNRLKRDGFLIPASGKNLAHESIPGIGKQRHYRLRYREFLGLDQDDGDDLDCPEDNAD